MKIVLQPIISIISTIITHHMSQLKFSKFKKYCYIRLKVDELGLKDYDYLDIEDYFEPIYKKLYDESEKLYKPNNNIKIRNNWLNVKKDYLDILCGVVEEQKGNVDWKTFLGILIATKLMIRTYKQVNPLFASMLCLEMLDIMKKLEHVCSWTAKKIKKEKTRNEYCLDSSLLNCKHYKSNIGRDSVIVLTAICSFYCLYRVLVE